MFKLISECIITNTKLLEKPLTNEKKNHIQVLSQRDMGRFQEVTTSTIDLGNSTLSGFAIVMSLKRQKWNDKKID